MNKTRRPIPPRLLERVRNFTDFAHLQFMKMGKGVEFFDVVAVKGTWDIVGDSLVLADTQRAIEPSDRYWNEDDAERSSLRIAGDAVVTKPACDVYVTGSARLPAGERRAGWVAGLRLMEGRRKLVEASLQLTGPRVWTHGLVGGWTLSDPVPANAVELRYENAFGGSYARIDRRTKASVWTAHAGNPCGAGFVDLDAVDRSRPIRAHQIEIPGEPVRALNQDYPLTGIGPLPRFWPQRTRWGGTYDRKWQEQFDNSIVPDYPDDFDERFFQAAPPSMICPHLETSETLILVNLMPASGLITLPLPRIGVAAFASNAANDEAAWPAALDTLHVDLDARQLMLTWRFVLPRVADVRDLQIYAAPFASIPGFSPRGDR